MKILKKILLYSVLSITAMLLLAIGGIYLFSGKIKTRVENIISEQLATDVRVKDINLSAFAYFPNITIDFNTIRAAETAKMLNKPLLTLEKFTVSLDVWNIISGKYKFKNIAFYNGEINAAGSNDTINFSLFKKKNNSKPAKYQLDLDKITLENIKLNYFNTDKNDTAKILLEHAQLSGRFNENQYVLEVKSILVPQCIKINNTKFEIPQKINFETSFLVNAADKSYSFTNTRLTLENLGFIVNGKINGGEKSTAVNLEIKGDGLNLAQLVSLIPQRYMQGIQDFESKGSIEFSLKMKGNFSENEIPDITASYKIANGELSKKGSDVRLNDIQLNGDLEYSAKKGKTISKLRILNIRTRLDGQSLQGNLSLENFADPYLKASVAGNIDLKRLDNLLKLNALEKLEGKATLQLALEGKTDDFKRYKEGVPALFEGRVSAENISLKIKGSPYRYENITGGFTINNNHLEISGLSGKINGNELHIDGKATGLLPYLFNTGKHLYVEGTLSSPKINFPTLLADDEAGSKTNDTGSIVIPKNIEFKLGSTIGTFLYDKFSARDVKGTIIIKESVFSLQNLDFEALQGRINLTGNINQRADKSFVVSARMKAENIELQRLFYEFGSFGQATLTDKNLQGTLTADIQFAAPMDRHLNIQTEKLYTLADLKISGGRLVDFLPLQSLSKFIEMDELKDISFQELKNTIEIKNSTVTLPQMELKNNVLNLTMEGSHTFDNYMDYHFSLRLKDAMSKKFLKRKNKPENVVEDEVGIIVFASLKGKPDNVQVKWDKQSARKKVIEDIKKEKKSFKELLRNEFGIEKNKERKESDGEDTPDWQTDLPE